MKIFAALTLSSLLIAQSLSADALNDNCHQPWKKSNTESGLAMLQMPASIHNSSESNFLNSMSQAASQDAMVLPAGFQKTAYHVKFRAAYLEENTSDQPFRGNVVYLEGLGDSMMNHYPLFKAITDAGFRVIAFDYMGQGGSEGSMNDTRIEDIPVMAEAALQAFGRDLEHFEKPVLIGWSTGGLAAYLAALELKTDKVVLIAPGISPNKLVGEKFHTSTPDEITLRTLTHVPSDGTCNDPHREKISPTSPLFVLSFALDLQKTAKRVSASQIKMDSSVRGLVLLSGPYDTYVDFEKTDAVLAQNAPNFMRVVYPDALHEVDNEVSVTAQAVRARIVEFLLP